MKQRKTLQSVTILQWVSIFMMLSNTYVRNYYYFATACFIMLYAVFLDWRSNRHE
jgi:hypothetical protein